MATNNDKVLLPIPPFSEKFIDSGGYCSQPFQRWLTLLYEGKLGGINSKNLPDMQNEINTGATTIEEINQNIVKLNENIQSAVKNIGTINDEIDTIVQKANQDHQSIVTTAEKVENIQKDIDNIKTNITGITNRVSDLEKDKYTFNIYTSLPTPDPLNAKKWGFYNGNMIYSVDGSEWRNFKDNLIVT